MDSLATYLYFDALGAIWSRERFSGRKAERAESVSDERDSLEGRAGVGDEKGSRNIVVGYSSRDVRRQSIRIFSSVHERCMYGTYLCTFQFGD